MKTNLLYFTLFIFSLSACNEEMTEPTGLRDCDVEIGSYNLIASSIKAVPYGGKTKIIFKDSLENIEEFIVTEGSLFFSKGTYFHYDVNMTGDTVKYCYSAQRKSFGIRNESLGINFSVSLLATPYYTDPESGRVADLLEIYYSNLSDNNFTFYQVFRKMISQRTYPQPYPLNEQFETIQFLGFPFNDVEKTQFSNPKLILYYNHTEGIVAFRDKSDRLWRFSAMK